MSRIFKRDSYSSIHACLLLDRPCALVARMSNIEYARTYIMMLFVWEVICVFMSAFIGVVDHSKHLSCFTSIGY